MSESIHVEPLKLSLKEKLRKATEKSVEFCYQCGKCTAGCPLADEMDYAPNQILRMLQIDMPQFEDIVLGSLSIWLCLTCQTCYSRCPKEVDLPFIMDTLRAESIRRGKVNPKAKDIIAFHESFLNSIEKSGRLHEVGLVRSYKLKTGHLMQDVMSAPKLFFNGKLSLLPHKIENRKAISNIFDKLGQGKGDSL